MMSFGTLNMTINIMFIRMMMLKILKMRMYGMKTTLIMKSGEITMKNGKMRNGKMRMMITWMMKI